MSSPNSKYSKYFNICLLGLKLGKSLSEILEMTWVEYKIWCDFIAQYPIDDHYVEKIRLMKLRKIYHAEKLDKSDFLYPWEEDQLFEEKNIDPEQIINTLKNSGLKFKVEPNTND